MKKDKVITENIYQHHQDRMIEGNNSQRSSEVMDLDISDPGEKTLKEAEKPEEGFSRRLAKNLVLHEPPNPKKRHILLMVATIIAVILIVVYAVIRLSPFGNTNIVQAMEDAFAAVKSYYGSVEIIGRNAQGEAVVQTSLEVWSDQKGRYCVEIEEDSGDRVITVNNGNKKWQIQEAEKTAVIFPASPDPYRFIFELGEEIRATRKALSTRAVGEEMLLGRMTTILEVNPVDGDPYRLWIDHKTKLPVKKQTAMRNGLQYEAVYSQLSTGDSMPEWLTSYVLPEGFTEIENHPLQLVACMEEAEKILGWSIAIPEAAGYDLDSISVETLRNVLMLTYKCEDEAARLDLLISQSLGGIEPSPDAILGMVGENTAIIQSPVQGVSGILEAVSYAGSTDISAIRWEKGGFEYAVVGATSLENLETFVEAFGLGMVEYTRVDEGKH